MIKLEATHQPLERLNAALGEVIALGRRTPAEIVRRTAADLVLGASERNARATGGVAYKGIFAELYETAPREGVITAEAEARGWTVTPNSKSTKLAEERANKILGSDESGVFSVQRGSAGRQLAPKRVFVRTRGQGKGQFRTATGRRATPKTARWAKAGKGFANESLRQFYARRGYKILTRQALISTLALSIRESGRGSLAAGFLPRRYRRILIRKSRIEYTKGGMAKGISSVDLAATHEHRTVVVKNKSGTELGSVDLDLGSTASARIRGFRNVPSRHMHRVDRAVDAVAADRINYLNNRLSKEILREMRKKGIR